MSDKVLKGKVELLDGGAMIRFADGSVARNSKRGGAGPRLDVLPDPPWDRAKGERVANWALFNEYLSMGPERTIRGFVKSRGLRLSRVSSICGRFRWIERAELFDQEQIRLDRAAQDDARREMARRHAQIALDLQRKAIDRLEVIGTETLDARDVARFLDVATRLERLARGEPTEITEGETTHTFRPLSNDELDAFERGGA